MGLGQGAVHVAQLERGEGEPLRLEPGEDLADETTLDGIGLDFRSASIEIGRLLLPKTFEEVHVWEWQAPEWRPALRLK